MPRNTADSLREQINRANEQSLHRKRTEAEQKNGQPPAQTRPAPVQNPQRPPVQNRQNPTAGQSRPQNGTVPQNRPAGQTTARNTTVNSTAVPQTRPAVPQNRSGSGTTVPQNRTGNGPAVPQNRTGSGTAVPQNRNGSGTTVPQNRTGNGTAVPQNRVPVQRAAAENNTRSQAQAGSTAANAARPAAPQRQNTGGSSSAAARMGHTRVTDISAIQQRTGSAPVKQIKPKTPRFERTEVVYEDEGGNTIASIVKAVVYMIFVVVISVFLAIAIINVGNDVFAFVKNDVSIDVKIPEYATLDDITQILYENQVIQYPSVFKLYAQLKKDNGEYIAGDYVVRPNMSYDELRAAFKPQPKVGISRITIPEGYTTDEIIDLMVSYGIGTREGYVDAIQNYDFDYWFLNELEEDGVDENRIYRLDGYLFPDTYDFYNSSSEVAVLNKLLKRFGQIFTEEYKIQTELMGYTVDDIINLASLIEKEAANPSEFFKVSSVFHNRLKNWKSRPMLESDATIVYAIQHETGERPKLTGTDYDTPYNTYHHAGLPPGPIANPSASAMLAALSPADTEYYYFVADGNVSYFSETKEQHAIFIEEIKKGTIREYYANMGKEKEEDTEETAQ